MTAPHVLVVDDEPDIRNLVKEILEDEGYEVSVAEGGIAAEAARRARRTDLVLLDIWMPDVDGITLLKGWADQGSLPCPVIMMSGHGTVETAVEATRLGAYDFIEKPLSLAKLLLTVKNALVVDRLRQENQGLRQRMRHDGDLVGKSRELGLLREQVKRIAEHDTWVLISGEPGVGKRSFARHLHGISTRREGAFVELAPGSIAVEHSAEELFGSEESGKLRYGRLEQANGGILFLDEVADMDLATQARLLSALHSGSFVRVGGDEPVHINVRVVATTTHDLEHRVAAGQFREDLYYHLNVVPLRIPPLREHIADVPELLGYFVDMFVEQESLSYRHFSVAAQNRLRHHNWPGNVRELKNLVQRLLILGNAPEISADEIEVTLGAPVPIPQATTPLAIALDQPLREAREQFERVYLQHQLEACGASIGRLAKLTGMERTHLYRKLRALGIELKRGID